MVACLAPRKMVAALAMVSLTLLKALDKGALMNIITLPPSRIAKLAFLLIIVTAAVGAIVLFPRWSNANAPGYKLATLDRGPIVSTVTATGTI